MKKNKGKNFGKITDFFQKEKNNLNIEEINDKSGNQIALEKINDKNSLNLEEDDSSAIKSNHQLIENNNDKNKRKKIEEINNFNHNNCNIPSFFINLNCQSPIDNNRKIILLDLTDSKTLKLQQLNIFPNNFTNPKDYNPSFPFQYCKIINIDNTAYITGGVLNDYFSKLNYNNELGEKKCYKIIYNPVKNEIIINKIPSSIFEHQSHSLLYSKRFNTIFQCSGHKQKNCEYLNLNEKELNWKRLHPLKQARENALAFLFNEKYIFLIGGKNQEGIINEDYDVIDFEIFISNKVQNYWKTYSFENKIILERLGCGIINKKNDVYILGGYNEKKEFCSWKINLVQDEDDESLIYIKEKFDGIYKINSVDICDKINNYFKKQKYINCICFCGQQNFFNYNGFFFNISLGGKLSIVPENLV